MTALTSATTSAQPNIPEDNWKKRMMSEKVAFFTVELDLTPEEAQQFWPVYNQIDKEKDEANANVFMTFIELEKAIKTKKPEKEISDLLDKHMDAIEKQNEITSKADEKYRKVLPVAKVCHLGYQS
jgi:Spy/CpxP family protein refolding chaperone